MTWGRLDDGFHGHPKLAALGPPMLPCVGLHTLALSWCNQYLTDGHVPREQVPRLAGDLSTVVPGGQPWPLVDALVSAGFWELATDGYQIHDFLDYNPSRDDVLKERVLASQRQDKWRRGHTRPDVTNGVTNGVTNATPLPSPIPNPIPIPVPEPEPKKENRIARASARARPARGAPNLTTGTDSEGFERFWRRYPNRVGKGDAMRSWARHRLDGEVDAILAGLERNWGYLTREDGRYIPNPATWLNQRRWLDEPKPLANSTQKTAANRAAVTDFVDGMRAP